MERYPIEYSITFRSFLFDGVLAHRLLVVGISGTHSGCITRDPWNRRYGGRSRRVRTVGDWERSPSSSRIATHVDTVDENVILDPYLDAE